MLGSVDIVRKPERYRPERNEVERRISRFPANRKILRLRLRMTDYSLRKDVNNARLLLFQLKLFDIDRRGGIFHFQAVQCLDDRL